MYWEPKAASYYGSLRFVKAGTKFKVLRVADWGMEDGILYPIYETDNDTLIRGIDVTGSDSVSRASDGKGGFHTLVYQPILENITLDDVHKFNNEWRNEKRTLSEELEDYFRHKMTYEGRFREGGFETNFAEYTDPQGKTYRLSIGSKAGALKLLYPLNMDNPVPILQIDSFWGGNGGGSYKTILKSISKSMGNAAYLHYICEYRYTSADGGYDGLAYHYFNDDGVYVYQYQTDEMGNIEKSRRYRYVQYGNPYEFHSIDYGAGIGEPKGKSRFGCFTKGSYWNPICRLKLRSSAGGEVIGTIEGGTLLEVLEEGKKATIDGCPSAWVKVRAVNRECFVDGGDFTQTGWVFGAYLE